jgi:predicted aldo/keto reductase-like oxidoreductase
MVDEFLARGFTYFDTAWPYCNFNSENALREALVERHPRESYTVATKLHCVFFNTKEERDHIFAEQLRKTGAGYFDYYLIHAVNAEFYKKYTELDCFNWLSDLKARGLVKNMGFSFHDSAEVLDKVLTEHPEMDFVQLQINYLDWEDKGVQSRLCYEVARKHGKDIIVMEPVKGGKLANVPEKVEKIFKDVHPDWSVASWAVRFAAGLEGVICVLSGMSDMEQLRDNMSYTKEFEPLGERELNLLKTAAGIINDKESIPCTSCRYCVAGCPKDIPIPEYFTAYNKKLAGDTDYKEYFLANTDKKGRADQCIKCRKCEQSCPQHIEIVDKLELVKDII